MQCGKERNNDVRRVFENANRCMNPDCNHPLKYVKYHPLGYCSRKCQREHTPIMVYFSRLYDMPFRDMLVLMLNRHKTQIAVADHLRVGAKTVCVWVRKLDIKKHAGIWT